MRALTIPANGVNQPNPQGIAVSPDGRWLLVSEAVAGGSVTILDINNNYTVEDTLVMATGNTARGVSVSPDNTRAYIAVSGDDNEVWSYDLASLTVDAKIVVGTSPASIAVTPDAKWLYITNAPANTVDYYEPGTGGGGEIDLGPGVEPTALAITPDGLNVFVTSSTNSIWIIDVLSKLVTPVNVGGASAGVSISPDGKRAYVTIPSLNKIVEIGNQRTLRISKQGGGIGIVSSRPSGVLCGTTCIASFNDGDLVDLFAIADYSGNSRFSYWSGDADCSDGQVTMNANMFCVAYFSPPPNTENCFVATAAYGSWLDPHVVTLRDFRDHHLLTNRLGSLFVEFYYRHSPPIADFIRDREFLRATVRSILALIIFTIEYPITTGFVILLIIVVRIRQKSERKSLGYGI